MVLLIGNKLCVMGDWDDSPVPAGRLDIRLKPGRAWGNGSHPSTVAMLEELELLITGGETVLDIGTGSGILAIAAAKLGASKVYGVDVSSAASEAVRVNAVLSHVERTIEIIEDRWPQPLSVPVDLVVMNIDEAGLIERVLAELKLTSGGKAVLVIDADDRIAVEATALTGGLSLLRTREGGQFTRPARQSSSIQDTQGQTFLATGLQQQASRIALVFQKGV